MHRRQRLPRHPGLRTGGRRRTVPLPGTYAAGLYNRLTDEVAGVRIENESLVNLPNWLSLKFRIDGGDWFDIDSATLLSYRQNMDLRQAELYREFRFRDPGGRTCKVAQRRIAAMHLPHACALETTIWAEDWSGTIEFLSMVDGDVRNSGVERYRALSDDHLVATTTRELSANAVLLVCQTVQSRIPIAVAARTTLWRGEEPLQIDSRFVDEPRRVGHDYVVSMSPGDSVTVEKMAAIFTGRDHAIAEPGDAAERLLRQLGRYSDLREGHVREWAHLWERFDIAFDDNPDAMRVVRLHLLQLLQTVPNRTEDLDAGLGARGLHGEAYRGHVFWDELFVFPVLNLRSPRPPDRCCATATGGCPKPAGPRRRPATPGRCSPGSPAATVARRARSCTSTRTPGTGIPMPAPAPTTSVSRWPTTSGSTTRSPVTWST